MDPPPEFMDYSNEGSYSPKHQKPKMRGSRGGMRNQPPPATDPYGSTPLFEDTSGYNDPNVFHQQDLSTPQQPMYPGQQFLQDPTTHMAANMAMQYGQQFVPAAGEYVEKKNFRKWIRKDSPKIFIIMITKLLYKLKIESFLSISKLKYYFAVDTSYVLKKLGLIAFPFAHEDWSLKYDNKSEPVAPRYEINSPDLYIPSMAFVTYVLICGLIFGTQNRFTPEQLGMTASHVLVCLIIELCIIITTLYVTGITGNVRYLDLLSLCGYKYVGMIGAAVAGLLFHLTGYYLVLGWMSLSIAFFLARTLRLVINPDGVQSDSMGRSPGATRRLYLLLYISLTQPVLMWFLTKNLNQYTYS